jgi:hypothetical protein
LLQDRQFAAQGKGRIRQRNALDVRRDSGFKPYRSPGCHVDGGSSTAPMPSVRITGTSEAPSTLLPWKYSSGQDQGSMRRAVSVFSRGWVIGRSALAGIAILGLLAAPAQSPAQDAGVSGIPPGPGNVNGLNGSVRDPSGIGNAARMPALPQPTITPVNPPTLSTPTAAYRTSSLRGPVRMRRSRFAKSRYNRAAVNAAIKENDRLLDRKLTSICRGC